MQINRASRNAFGCLSRRLFVTRLLIAGFAKVDHWAGYAADTPGMVNL
jgi:hypothetical protein